MIRVLVVHPLRLMCDLLSTALKEESDIEVVGFARTGEEALVKIQKQPVNIVLINVNLPDSDVLRLTRTISTAHKSVKVVITGLLPSKMAVLCCVEEGAAGYVLEDDSLGELVKKIRAVHRDQFAVPPSIARTLIVRLAELKRKVQEIRTLTIVQTGNQPSDLTAREWEILRLIEQGRSNQQIAETLVIELGTVKNHVHNILYKLNVQNRKHAVIFARQLLEKPASLPPTPALAGSFMPYTSAARALPAS